MDTKDLLTAFIRMSDEQKINFIDELEANRATVGAPIISAFHDLRFLSSTQFKDAVFNEIYRSVKDAA